MHIGPITGILAGALFSGAFALAEQQPPVATFAAGVELVRVSAVVRDRKGRFVEDLTARDFEVLDAGRPQPIADFRPELAGVSVALLFDVSGSMEARLAGAREAATHVISWLEPDRDEAAVFLFDTRLDEAVPFTSGLRALPPSMASVVPFGATSLFDAIAETARKVAARQGRRRAVVVLTDGNDNASRLTPSEVSGLASGVDVPVYVIATVSSIDNPADDVALSGRLSPPVGDLSDFAEWTGGHVFLASTPAERSAAARQIVDELRHQYLLAFESTGAAGWHPLVVRARGKDLVVRTRSGYFAGQSRPDTR